MLIDIFSIAFAATICVGLIWWAWHVQKCNAYCTKMSNLGYDIGMSELDYISLLIGDHEEFHEYMKIHDELSKRRSKLIMGLIKNPKAWSRFWVPLDLWLSEEDIRAIRSDKFPEIIYTYNATN